MKEAKDISALADKLQARFGSDLVSMDAGGGIPVAVVSKDRIFDVISFLYREEDLAFRFLTTLCGVHYPLHEKDRTYSVVYHLHSLTSNTRLRVKIFFSEDKPEVPSLTPLFSAANWMEREAYDFYGIIFKGHPDLRRILNMDDMKGFPMRKEFPLEDPTREDKDDSMFGR